ncbi:hypothetical protein A3B45_00760 [Candidatus Daviesbacteria bacterium RIFCSPLOWO2_01_FULL_39_12]|uniref:Phosphoribosyltransferase domain-containing protein n=1 Tax=Candidatus Daviesbacteria bacterium RIFCSPLOWO2_01_FULL_39_12 TaxID=1797785 RepID=A0A1F5KRK5_9BACT|nr:MAG: hypothetical protein A3D79_01930 [Candidatus Daviesbacteria bacterium RIFCSPHIGHO2_02_FULL_39_8]OGE43271.1 MAG: hypothetical protein A3B45_00760 [Candidatus Daviesbacteria bacterium RIFCSPLOWO2_01_FULL_39_12]
MFKDRQSAGKLLTKHLQEYKGTDNVVVLAIPRGGVVVAKEVASDLNLALDIIVTRKIGAPMQPELALGAVDADGEVVWDERMINDLGLKIEDLADTVKKEVEEIKRREKEYRHERPGLAKLIEGKEIILVDDGIATGATTLAAVNYLKRHKAAKIVLAIPVASQEAANKLSEKVDQLIILETPEYFQAVGQFYEEFGEVTDEEVVELLNHGR